MHKLIIFLYFSIFLPASTFASNINMDPTQLHQLKGIAGLYQPYKNISKPVKFVLNEKRIWHPGKSYKSSNNWLALVCEQDACSLQAASLKVINEPWQGHYDDKPTNGQTLSFSPQSSNNSTVIAWFNTQSAPSWLKKGAVQSYLNPAGKYEPTSTRGTLETRVTTPNGYIDIVPMAVKSSILKSIAAKIHYRKHDPIYILQLRQDKQRQLLFGILGTCYGSESIHPKKYLPWSGDLDKDGKPDYLISFIDEDGNVDLYLSGVASNNEIVGLGGVYTSPPLDAECTY